MIFISKFLVPKGYLGMTVFPFVFLKYNRLKKDVILVNHEKIHLRQQLELLVIPFYVVYLSEFIVRLIQFKNWNLAYRNVSFEQEAYINESNIEYLKNRKFWSFLKYLRNHDIQA
ncbi:hypothetical protein [uncultured Algibacter sp.]|uniref:hypothetical protein n=1 Tax=uncultured Algibacter sp. TaxID=298659 RepID=UPI002622053B|nr:hypothetical protein [uncultured Algibacter sp.]